MAGSTRKTAASKTTTSAADAALTPDDTSNTDNVEADVDGVASQSEVDAQRADSTNDGTGSGAEGDGTPETSDGTDKGEAHDADDSKAQPDQDIDGIATPGEADAQRGPAEDGRPADGIGSGVRSLAEPPTALASARTPSSGPLDPPDKTQEFAPVPQGDFADEAGPREDETVLEHLALQDADGNAVTYEDVFDDDGTKTFVTTKMRVYRTFTFPNSDVEGRALQYTEGKRVSRVEASQVQRRLNVGTDDEEKAPA